MHVVHVVGAGSIFSRVEISHDLKKLKKSPPMCDTQRKKVVDAIEARQDNIFSAIRQVTPVCHSKPILNPF